MFSVRTKPRNHLLAQLEPDELSRLMLCMELQDLGIRSVLYQPNTAITHAYFPESGVMSIVTPFEEGPSVEAITVGFEGVVGLPLILGANSSLTKAFCQVPGSVWAISAADFLKSVESSPRLSLLLRRYAQTVFDTMAQNAACNRLHTIEQRCARWLLLTHDRIDSDTFQLTQEFLAVMLGVRRPGVNLVAKTLQTAGLIDYKHGKITIINRTGLEKVCCKCYQIICASIRSAEKLPA